MRLFIAFVFDLKTAFDPSLHCDPDAPLFAFRLREIEDAYATVEISRLQSGWAFLSPAQAKNFLVSWSPTGAPADAILIARGRVKERPRDLLGRRQTIIGECAPKNIDDRILAIGKRDFAHAPVSDFLFSDADPEDRQAYLLGTPAVWHVDPATHEIRTVHLTEGDRILDMRDVAFFPGGLPADGPGDAGAKMSATLRQKLTVDWVQEASGMNDVGPDLSDRPAQERLTTLDPHFFENLRIAFRSDASEGWSLADAGVDYVATARESNRRATGTRYRSVVRDDHNAVPSERLTTQEHQLKATAMVHILEKCSFPLRYEYSQSRREQVHAALDLPALETGIEYEDTELTELSLRDVFVDPQATEYEANKHYPKGSLVRKNGQTYRCVQDHFSTDFQQHMATVQASDLPVFAGTAWGLVGNFKVERTYFDLVSAEWSVKPSMYSFFDTSRGRECIRHLMLRMRRAGIHALRDSRIAMSFRWADAAHLTRADSIRFLVPDADGYRAVVGKIVSIERVWPENGAPKIEVEVGVSFAADREGLDTDDYVEPGYVEPGYAVGDTLFPGAAAEDLRFETQADPVRKPVLVENLHGQYGIRRIRVGGMAPEQLAAFSALAAAGDDVRQASVVRPSWIEIVMRPLPQLETLVREIDVVGELVRGSQGVEI